MKTKELHKVLIEKGFWKKRSNHHEVWTDGKEIVVVSHGSEQKSRYATQTLKKLTERQTDD